MTRSRVPLKLGPLGAAGYDVQRSGFRWLCPDGHLCRAGKAIAYCNIGVVPKVATKGSVPFASEASDFQAVLAPRQAGRLIRAEAATQGGHIDVGEFYFSWSPDTVIGSLECDEPVGDNASQLRTMLVAGRRQADFAEARHGLLGGWFDRCRGWWADGDGPMGNVLSLGICEQLGIIRGEHHAFLELFEMAPGPAHIALIPDDLLVPAAPALCAQLRHTPEHTAGILQSLVQRLGTEIARQPPQDPQGMSAWIFAGALLRKLAGSPLLETNSVLTASGLRTLGPPQAVILSLHSESGVLLRHRRRDYFLCLHGFRIMRASPAVGRWLRQDFEAVRRTPEETQRDIIELIDTLQKRTQAHVLILNGMSSLGMSRTFCYAPFDKPLNANLTTVRDKDHNLMLYDLARQRDISIVDVDALAVRLGGKHHVPDGVHHSGLLQAAVRRQIVKILHERGIPGWGK